MALPQILALALLASCLRTGNTIATGSSGAGRLIPLELAKDSHNDAIRENPYSCTVKDLNQIHKRFFRSLRTFKLSIQRTGTVDVPDSRFRMQSISKRINKVRRHLKAYKYPEAERTLRRILQEVQAHGAVADVPSTGHHGDINPVHTYDTSLTLLYASASCYYYLNPGPLADTSLPSVSPQPDSGIAPDIGSSLAPTTQGPSPEASSEPAVPDSTALDATPPSGPSLIEEPSTRSIFRMNLYCKLFGCNPGHVAF